MIYTYPHFTFEPVNIYVQRKSFTRTKIIKRTKSEEVNKRKIGIRNIIQESRSRIGLTQKELAKIANVKWTEIRDLENGNVKVDEDRIEKICRALNIRNI